jgi:membrane-associated phospholipid phosphatase
LIGLLLIAAAHADSKPIGIDAISPFSYRPVPAVASDVLLGSAGVAAFGVAVRDWKMGGSAGALGGTTSSIVLTMAATEVTKRASDRRRPYTWDASRPQFRASGYCASGPPADDCKSFFSGHTSMLATSSFSAAEALRVSGELGDRVWLPYAAAGTLTLGMGALRVAAGKHYISDVAVGAAIGTATGVLIPRLFQR